MNILKKIGIAAIITAVLFEFVLPNSISTVKLFLQAFTFGGGIVLIYVSTLPMWKE